MFIEWSFCFVRNDSLTSINYKKSKKNERRIADFSLQYSITKSISKLYMKTPRDTLDVVFRGV